MDFMRYILEESSASCGYVCQHLMELAVSQDTCEACLTHRARSTPPQRGCPSQKCPSIAIVAQPRRPRRSVSCTVPANASRSPPGSASRLLSTRRTVWLAGSCDRPLQHRIGNGDHIITTRRGERSSLSRFTSRTCAVGSHKQHCTVVLLYVSCQLNEATCGVPVASCLQPQCPMRSCISISLERT